VPAGGDFFPPVLGGFAADEDLHVRNWRALRDWLQGPSRIGMSRCRIQRLGDQTGIVTATDTVLNMAGLTVEVDTDRYTADKANDRLRVPFAGQYLLICHVRWEANALGDRRLFAQRSTDAAAWTPLKEQGFLDTRPTVATAGWTTSNLIAGVISLPRLEYIRFQLTQTSGTNRTLEDWNAAMFFLGPS